VTRNPYDTLSSLHHLGARLLPGSLELRSTANKYLEGELEACRRIREEQARRFHDVPPASAMPIKVPRRRRS
jgi:hypothetical protein